MIVDEHMSMNEVDEKKNMNEEGEEKKCRWWRCMWMKEMNVSERECWWNIWVWEDLWMWIEKMSVMRFM